MKHRKPRLRVWTIFKTQDRSVLSRAAETVPLNVVGTSDFQGLIDDMVKTMYDANGIGLAAPQIGKSWRLAIVAPEADRTLSAPVVLINPTIKQASVEQEDGEEGCLSVPGVFGRVRRSKNISIAAFDRHGKPLQLQAQDLFARVIQHELDHLDGVLFLQRSMKITRGQELLS